MQKVVILSLATAVTLVALLSRGNEVDSYEQWKQDFGLNFGSSEDFYRKMLFMITQKEVEEFNKKSDRTYEKGINQFSHLTDDEFLAPFTSHIDSSHHAQNVDIDFKYVGADIDWALDGKVSPVKNQQGCDAGYAFSTTSLLESYFLITKSANYSFSDQQLVDCSGSYGTSGCQGGSRLGAINYIKDKGIAYESEYPFKAVASTCKKDGGLQKISSFSQTTNCSGLAEALKKGPISIAADATNWRSYRSGIFSNCTEKVTHDVLLVGLTTNYWKIKNSWGLNWGEYGYIRLSTGNTCGICSVTGYWFN
jgi:C1A family cysteine protease